MATNGTQITDMTPVAVDDAPSTALVPFVVETQTGLFSPSQNYITDVIAGLLARPTSAALAASSGSSLIGFIQSGTDALAQTAQDKLRHIVHLTDFEGATPEAKFANALAMVIANFGGGEIVFPPGEYELTAALDIPIDYTDFPGNLKLSGYGAILKTTGAIFAIEVTDFTYPRRLVIEGFHIEQEGNADALGGISIAHAQNTIVRNVTLGWGDNGASYCGIWVHNQTPSDNDTGAFWTILENVAGRATSSSADKCPVGILLTGAANASRITGGSLTDCDVGILLRAETGQTYCPNAVLIEGVSFEQGSVAVELQGNGTEHVNGCRIRNCRAERLDYFLDLTGGSVQAPKPVNLGGNTLITSSPAIGYIRNVNNIRYDSEDVSVTPAFNGIVGRRLNYGTFDFGSVLATDPGLQVRKFGPGPSFALIYQAGASDIRTLVNFDFVSSSKIRMSRLAVPNTTSQFAPICLTTIKGLSSTATDSENLCGTATLAAGTASVSFATAEADTSYRILLSCSAVETLGWSSKSTGGFTITSSNGSSTATVNWMIVR